MSVGCVGVCCVEMWVRGCRWGPHSLLLFPGHQLQTEPRPEPRARPELRTDPRPRPPNCCIMKTYCIDSLLPATNIYRMEKDIEALEREEAIVSKNESFILEQLRVVEKSTQDIIKEAHDTFIPVNPPPVATVTPDSPTNDPVRPDTPPRKTLFAMEINVNKNLRTGESSVLSTSSIQPEDLHRHSGHKVYDDGRKCVYALGSLEGSDDQSSVSELSASEVEQLLKSATEHRRRNQHGNGHACYCRNRHPEHPRGPYDQEEVCCRVHHCQSINQQHQRRDIQRGTSFKLPVNHQRYTSKQLRRHQSFHSSGYSSQNDLINNNSFICNRGDRCPSLKPHDPEVSCNQGNRRPSPRYTPASHIPLSDYISAGEEEEEEAELMYNSPAPSPVFADDTPYTILSAMESGQPITAVFMGFQPAHDDCGRGQEFEGVMKAELVVIDDDYGKKEEDKKQEEGGAKERRAGRRVGAGIRKLQEKHCCTLS
ncbi:hypothetical protein WMY93_000327 [Mugilogobius chulae]|uniref:Palmdelphin n=1 Tax=Mugilogobius chulae TaxID=88201 RepID=A0AAW0QDY7_9GOBI